MKQLAVEDRVKLTAYASGLLDYWVRADVDETTRRQIASRVYRIIEHRYNPKHDEDQVKLYPSFVSSLMDDKHDGEWVATCYLEPASPLEALAAAVD